MQDFFSLITFDSAGAEKAITAANEATAENGLTLSPDEIRSLCAVYRDSLTENSIVEFGAGGVVKIQKAFSASCYADRSNFAEIVEAMTETFYYIKRNVEPEIRDDTLIAAMVDAFDNHSGGSIEEFQNTDAALLIRYLNEGREDLTIAAEEDYSFAPRGRSSNRGGRYPDFGSDEDSEDPDEYYDDE